MRIFRSLAVLFFTLALVAGSAAAAFENDLSLLGAELVIQPASGVVEKQTVKIYTTVRNNGDKDLIGVVKFFVDGAQVATDQPVSVKQGSIPDEVFINWVALAGNHKISSQIFPAETEGDNPANNYAEKNFFVDADSDGDGVGDLIDVDDDNDGLKDDVEESLGTNPRKGDSDNDSVGDASDAFPTDPTEQMDSDGDGIGDNADEDDDNDGLPDTAEATLGTDPLNPDSDHDGVDLCNDLHDQFPLDSAECSDRDGDGVGDNADAFADDSAEWGDCDGDGVGDNADEDDDNDGVPDNADAFVCDPTESQDSDRDGLGDNADPNDANQGPVPVFDGDRIVIVNEEVDFDASRSTDADGQVVAFVWDFGDGTAIAENALAPHIFTSVGEYVVKLKVTDDRGESRVREAIVVVENSPWLEQTLLWLMLLLLLLFLYIFWKTVQHKKQKHHHR